MLATLDQIAAVAGRSAVTGAEKTMRAETLIQGATDQVVQFLAEQVGDPQLTESVITGQWTEAERGTIAVVVSEIAASRINVPAAAGSDPWGYDGTYMSWMIHKGHEARLLRLLRGRIIGGKASARSMASVRLGSTISGRLFELTDDGERRL
ncbi:hypothetical protein BH24ACT5_BH24ACT5_04770 [soil metagenome]